MKVCLKGQWSPSVTGYPLGGSGQAMSTTDPVAAGRDWRQEEKGTTEDEMAGWHYRLDAHEFG